MYLHMICMYIYIHDLSWISTTCMWLYVTLYDLSWAQRTGGRCLPLFSLKETVWNSYRLFNLTDATSWVLSSADSWFLFGKSWPVKVKSLWADWGVGWQTQRTNSGLREFSNNLWSSAVGHEMQPVGIVWKLKPSKARWNPSTDPAKKLGWETRCLWDRCNEQTANSWLLVNIKSMMFERLSYSVKRTANLENQGLHFQLFWSVELWSSKTGDLKVLFLETRNLRESCCINRVTFLAFCSNHKPRSSLGATISHWTASWWRWRLVREPPNGWRTW